MAYKKEVINYLNSMRLDFSESESKIVKHGLIKMIKKGYIKDVPTLYKSLEVLYR